MSSHHWPNPCVPWRSFHFCLVVVCEKTQPHTGAVDGDDLGAAGLFGGTTSSAPRIGSSKRDHPESNQPTDEPSGPKMGVSSVGRHWRDG